MNVHAMRTLPAVIVASALLSCGAPERRMVDPGSGATGFVVAAPDMGFLGNERLREIHEEYRRDFPLSALAFVTAARARERVETAVAEVRRRGAGRVVVLPLYLSEAESGYRRLADAMTGMSDLHRSSLPSADYHFAEILKDRVDEMRLSGGTLILVGSGAAAGEDAQRLERDLLDLAAWNHCRWKDRFPEIHAVALTASTEPGAPNESVTRLRALAQVAAAKGPVGIVPAFFGQEYDGMMSTLARLRRALDGLKVALPERAILPHPNVLRWLKRESRSHVPLADGDVGVVVVPHGADEEWNEEVRVALRSFESEFPVEYAFSMADAGLIQRAVDRLEQRGLTHIVVLRVFSLESSFRPEVEYMVGRSLCHDPWPGHVSFRIRSSATLDTLGGVGDDALYAAVLLERVRRISRNPSEETLFLTAHGARKDEDDERWRELLASLGRQIAGSGGLKFRSIEVGTWREDWPEPRRAAVADLRRRVEEAGRSGRALVVEERINGPGPARRFLEGLTFSLDDDGFAPHPNLGAWARKRVREAIERERRRRAPSGS